MTQDSNHCTHPILSLILSDRIILQIDTNLSIVKILIIVLVFDYNLVVENHNNVPRSDNDIIIIEIYKYIDKDQRRLDFFVETYEKLHLMERTKILHRRFFH